MADSQDDYEVDSEEMRADIEIDDESDEDSDSELSVDSETGEPLYIPRM